MCRIKKRIFLWVLKWDLWFGQLWILKGKICLVFDICCWYLLSWFWCNYSSWSSKLVDFTGKWIVNLTKAKLLCAFFFLICIFNFSFLSIVFVPVFPQPPPNIQYAAIVIGGSFIIEGKVHCIMRMIACPNHMIILDFSFYLIPPLTLLYPFFRCFSSCCHTSCQERCSCWGHEIKRLYMAWSWSYLCCSHDWGNLLSLCSFNQLIYFFPSRRMFPEISSLFGS